jgi:hypothetical protein
MAGNLATRPDFDALLDFHKTTNPGVIANLASIQIDEPVKLDPLSQPDVGCDAQTVLRLIRVEMHKADEPWAGQPRLAVGASDTGFGSLKIGQPSR